MLLGSALQQGSLLQSLLHGKLFIYLSFFTRFIQKRCFVVFNIVKTQSQLKKTERLVGDLFHVGYLKNFEWRNETACYFLRIIFRENINFWFHSFFPSLPKDIKRPSYHTPHNVDNHPQNHQHWGGRRKHPHHEHLRSRRPRNVDVPCYQRNWDW